MQNSNNWYVGTGENWRYVTNGARSGWQHIAAVFIPGVGTKFYKNGIEYSLPYINYDTNDSNLTIGRYGSSNNYFFWGAMDEVVVYNRPLSKEEIQDRFNQRVSFSVQGLSSATAYNFTVWPYVSSTCSWNGPHSSVVSTTTDDIAALTPTNFQHTFFNTTQIDLSWGDIASSETGYRLQRCTGSCDAAGDYSLLDQLEPADTTSFVDSSACQGQTYTYRVRAEGTVGGDSLWEYHEISTAPATQPGINLEVVSESEINITWGDFTPDEEQFILKRCAGSGAACDGIPDTEFDVLLTAEPGSIAGVSSIHYRMDEAAWANGATDVVDISGSDRHGQPYNDLTTVSAGKYDRAGEFNGTNHYIDTPLNIDQSATSNGVTFEAWVYPTVNNSTWKYLISTDDYIPSNGYDWSVMYINNEWYVTDGVSTWQASPNGVTFMEWQHIAVVFEPGVGVRFYNNGVETSSAQIGYDTSDFNVTIGRRGVRNQQYFQGDIDEVIIYERPLTASEITEHYTNQVAIYRYADSGLTAGSPYTYRIQAVKTAPSCSWTAETIDTASTTAPPAPTDLDVGGDTTTAALTWTDNSGSETDYRVQRCTGGSGSCDPAAAADAAEWSTEWLIAADSESHDDATVCPGNIFSYRVRAEQNPGWGSTTWDSVIGKVIPTPTTPTGLNFTKDSEVQISLGWTDETIDETGFTIEQCAGASCPATGTKKNLPVSPDATSYEAIELTPGLPYTFRIRADKASACGWPTAYSGEVTTDTIPYPPGSLGGSTVDTTGIDLNWDDNTASETDFVITRCLVDENDPPNCAGAYSQVGRVGQGVTDFTDTTACYDESYNYQVKAIGNGLSNSGEGCWTKKAPVSITSFQANTAVQIIIPYASYAPDMQADFRDIRFFDATARQELNTYWFADKVDGDTATVWFFTGDNDNIYMYYGNVDAIDSSITDAAFTRSYDLSATVIRTDDWVELEQPATNLITQNDGITFVWNTDNRTYNKGLISADTFERAAGNELYFDITTSYYTSSGGFYAAFGWAKDQTASPTTNQLMHGIEFYGDSRRNARFRIHENGGILNVINAVADYKRYSEYTNYQLKIVLKEPGADYWVKGGVFAGWTLIHQTSTDFAEDKTMRIAMLHHSQRLTINAVSVKHASNQDEVSAGTGGDMASCTGDFDIWESLNNINGPVTLATDNFADPDTLILTVTSDTSVDLAWNYSATDESGFNIYRCDSATWTCGELDGVFTPDASFAVGAGISTYTDSTLAPSAIVTYRVYAHKDTGYCSWDSGYAEATTASAAGAPDGLTATLVNCFQIELGWNDNGVDENGYEVEMQVWNGYYSQIGVTDANATTYLVKGGVEPGKTYRFRVRSYRGTAPDKSDYVYSAYSYIDTAETPGYVAGDGECVQ
jgi:hypothetical protein